MPEPITIVGFGGSLVGLAAHFAKNNFDLAKEVFDVVAGAVLGIIFLPLVSLCAALIKVSSKGPAFYSQMRIGKDGHLFKIYKLRTMHINAENGKAVWADKNDQRVIKSCKWMRSSHVDELPQLWNVIKGEMSLVGPRPERPEILEDIGKQYPEVATRHCVRPGITGLAQITNGYDTDLEHFKGKLSADLQYIKERRWSMELKILFRTIPKFHDTTAH